ncbi:Urea amidolyase [Wickerhamiella sorbophila]|uniref:Urea amidolyase n=1 Tax=Wickerhamiella sorbophila TaxID=45607 RepID=A0A2T0FI78_9ASCO|nr:Urea amidolyase [Wickerhamiella sorbophila]PRT54676.1 Urea amidolyase [Wickerhamiella sorbophila]
MMSETIGLTIDQWRSTQLQAAAGVALDRILQLAQSLSKDSPEWIYVATEKDIKDQWNTIDHSLKDDLPLYGVPYAVKDNIDVNGFPTTAACPKFEYLASSDATVVAQLRTAGAIVVGKTNLDQFATGLVGVRSPYGTPSSVFSEEHVSGGSSSGSAVVVGKGIVPFALGTDTAGSGRVPAALNNLIGVKPTVGIWSTTGVVPACKSLDAPTVFTLNLKDAEKILSIGIKYDNLNPYTRQFPERPVTTFGRRPILGVPKNPEFYGETENETLFYQVVNKVRDCGIEVVEVDCSDLFRLAKLLYEGPWVAERYHAIKDFINEQHMDPTVYNIISGAHGVSAIDAFDKEYIRQTIKKKFRAELGYLDGFVMPTCPLNPKIADVLAEPFLINSQQGTYTNFVNLADLSALAIPASFRSDGLPFGITFMSEAFNDFALLELAQRFLQTFENRQLGNTPAKVSQSGDTVGYTLPDGCSRRTMQLAVVGAHLSGMVLNWQLRKVNSTLAFRAKTAPKYKLWALKTTPPKPGLERVSSGGSPIEVEVWDVPVERFGEFISMVPQPLGIGTLELETGALVKGFICENAGLLEGAEDITSFGGWRSYIADRKIGKPFDTVLIANRGEIAVRMIKALKKMSIRSVAVYSEPDRHVQHVLDADVAVDLHGVSAAETYLSMRKIIDACKQTRAQAVLPGYGFLAENAEFAELCEKEGIIFIGPSAKIIRELGMKHTAREIAKKAGVPLTPGTGLLESIQEALEAADSIGYPVMIKSTAGGGGIGLQRVDNAADLPQVFNTVRHQGLQYFNDSGVFIEAFVENARHIEVQVFGDGFGKAIDLGERDCSLQRRNQKVIEETPAPNLPEKTRAALRKSARDLAAAMKYKCAGTIEYIFDPARDKYYFLEVNTRLQVEHPVTEEVTKLDLVEWMVNIAANRAPSFDNEIIPTGASMEARVYAENPVRDFAPSPGTITEVSFPKWARVDTWIFKGSTISSEYDPMIAKIIVHGKNRKDALELLQKALNETIISGVVTNLDYLRSVAGSQMFKEVKMFTKALDTYEYKPHAIEITAPGSATTIQDYPGRTGLWHIGVPPSGPMDSYAFRVANHIVGNHESAPAIECTLVGPSLVFHHDSLIALTGGTSTATLDGTIIPLWAPVSVKSGQQLVVGKLSSGCRAYLAVRGGLDVPEYLGSRSTFAQGSIGGYNGRALKFGDVVPIGQPELPCCTIPAPVHAPIEFPESLIPKYSNKWNVTVTCGPHGAPDFFKSEFLDTFFETEWKIHYNSNRFGVRLTGPKPHWARTDGGEAGLHPSNAHDYVYSLGAINFTGDEPVVLTCDGPSLGGFVCAGVITEADLWKMGQVKPGDLVKFSPVTVEHALILKKVVDQQVIGVETPIPALEEVHEDPILFFQEATVTSPKVVYRQAGDRYLLIEYGENVMDLNLRYRVHCLIEHTLGKVGGVIEMSPGVRSVHIEYDPAIISQSSLLDNLLGIEFNIKSSSDWKVKSRVIRLPMAFEDQKTLSAVERYQETIRSEAPWLPNNVDFIRDVNGLSDRNEVRNMMYSARFMVMGLGDVYLGAPCAVPLDPRHRLLGTKYNPSRSWTPNGTVGLGGMYMCIYTMESPGGYQLIGRTIPIWDKLCLNESAANGKPWLLSCFDQIEYYPVTEHKLEGFVTQVEQGDYKLEITETVFDAGDYHKFLKDNEQTISAHNLRIAARQDEFARVIAASESKATSETVKAPVEIFSDTATMIYAEVTGRFWKNMVEEGVNVSQHDCILILEAMKTELLVCASVAGTVVKILHKNGDMVEAGDLVAVIEP